MKSLRARVVVGGVIWAVLTIVVITFGLMSYLDRQTLFRFDELLRNRHTQAVIAVANSYTHPSEIERGIGDPTYLRPFSGQYWQISGPNNLLLVSPSLGDTLLLSPPRPEPGIVMQDFVGGKDEQLRGIGQWITMADGGSWYVQVASSTQSLATDRTLLRGNLVVALCCIALFGIFGAFLQASATLRPLNKLGEDVAARWDSEDGLDIESYPTEVVPLVSDINTLLHRNREVIGRSRRQAADLAHAIKTPSAIVRNELESLQQSGLSVARSIDALDRLDAQLKRSFARMRADGSTAGMNIFTDIPTALGRLTRAFTALARNEGKAVTADIPPDLRVRIDPSDFEEVMGNLMDNAIKWCKTTLHVRVVHQGDWVLISIEDDGPGIPQEDLIAATSSGRRLDTSKPGTGLGLAIATDIAHAYGGTVDLSASDRLGGLCVCFRLKATGV